MAFQNVNSRSSGGRATRDPIKLTGLKVGDSVTGHVLNFVDSLQNPDNKNILLQLEDGGTAYVYTAGNVKYMINDGKIQEGLLTRITRIDDKTVKGKRSSQFTVEQDADNTIDVSSAIASSVAAAASSSNDSFAAITSTTELSKSAAARESVKSTAAKLAQSMKR